MKPQGPLLILLAVSLTGAGSQLPPARARTSAVTRLTTTGLDTTPVCSPNGRRIAFVSYREGPEPWAPGAGDLFVMDADGGAVTKLTTEPHGRISAGSLEWSPNGTRILFLADPVNEWQVSDIFVVDADGRTGPVDLTNTFQVSDERATWSPDGRRIVYVAGGMIHVMNADGSGVTELTHAYPQNWDDYPAWSPNGQEIAFSRTEPFEPWSYDRHICVMKKDGSDVTVLTPEHGMHYLYPAWSPDGKTILTWRLLDRNWWGAAVVVDAWDGAETDVSNGVRVNYPGMWSPNGKRIAFGTAEGDLYVVDADATKLTRLTETTAVYEWGPPSWTRDGHALVFFASPIDAEGRTEPIGDIYAAWVGPAARRLNR